MFAPPQVKQKSDVRSHPPRVKLAAGATYDRLERDADRRANQALATSGAVDAGKAPRTIQPSGTVSATPPVSSSVSRVVASAGTPISPGTRRDMEQRFGEDFSHVRIHTGRAAARSAADVRARAYTVGSHIVFGERGSPSDRRLLAHELAHVVQSRTIARPLLLRQDEPPTFGNIPRDQPLPLADPNLRFRLVKQEGKWFELLPDGRKKPAAGAYDFVVQDEDIWAVRQPKPGRAGLGHTEAAMGERVRFAGGMRFTSSTQQLIEWDAVSGHYRAELGSARAPLLTAGLSEVELAKVDANAIEKAWAKAVEDAKMLGLPPPKRLGSQLGVIQPSKGQVLLPRGRGGDVKRLGSKTPEPVPQKTVVTGEFIAKPEPAAPKPGGSAGPAVESKAASKPKFVAGSLQSQALEEAAAKGGIGMKAKGLGVKAAKIAVKLIDALVPDPLDVLDLWIGFFGSLAEAKAKLRQEYFMRGFCLGVAARLYRLDAYDATRMLQIRSGPSIGERVAGWEGVRDVGRWEGVRAGYPLWNQLNSAQREVVLALRKGLVSAKRERVGPDAQLAYNFDDVLALALALQPTLEQWLQAAAEEERRRKREEEARRYLEREEANWRFRKL